MTAIDTDLISPWATDAATAPPPGYARRMRSVVYVQGMFNIRHLEHVYRLFEGDLVLSIVLSEIVQHHRADRLEGPHDPGVSALYEALVRDRVLRIAPGPVSPSVISQATGIPRDTVRRKIGTLRQHRWLGVTTAGGFQVTDEARQFFSYPHTFDSLSDFLDTDALLRQLLGLELDARPPWKTPPAPGRAARALPNWSTRTLFARSRLSTAAKQGQGGTSLIHLLGLYLNGYHLRGLIKLYARLDGDLLLSLVLGVIAHINLRSALMQPGQNLEEYEALLTAAGDDAERYGQGMMPANAYSVSEATGIPRETVRRKIARLLEMEWIIKRPSQGYTVTARPIKYFGPDYNVRMLNDLLTTAAQIRASLQWI